jgi:hypothetical protein
MHLKISFSAIALFIFIASSLCNATMIFSRVSQDSLAVGDRISLSVTVMSPRGSQVAPPPTENGFGKFTVKEWTSDKVEKKNADSLSFNYILTTYSPECCTIPALSFIQTVGNAIDTLHTQPVPIRLVLIPPSRSQDTALIRDIKALERVGAPSLLWLWLILGVICVVIALSIIRHYWKKRIAPAQIIPPKPPYEEAMELLRILEAKQYIAKGMIREYVFELSDIVKRYVGRRFAINAAEFTTGEMLEWIDISPLEALPRRNLGWFFSTTDPVKFAKWMPDTDTVRRFGADMLEFIQQTKPGETQTENKETEKNHASP